MIQVDLRKPFDTENDQISETTIGEGGTTAAGTAATTTNRSLGPLNFQLQLTRVECIALANVACLVAAAEPANALFGCAVRE